MYIIPEGNKASGIFLCQILDKNPGCQPLKMLLYTREKQQEIAGFSLKFFEIYE